MYHAYTVFKIHNITGVKMLKRKKEMREITAGIYRSRLPQRPEQQEARKLSQEILRRVDMVKASNVPGGTEEDVQNIAKRQLFPFWRIIFYNFDSMHIANETMCHFYVDEQKGFYEATQPECDPHTGDLLITKDQVYFIQNLLPVLAERTTNHIVFFAIMKHKYCDDNIKALLLQNPATPARILQTIIKQIKPSDDGAVHGRNITVLRNFLSDPRRCTGDLLVLAQQQLFFLSFRYAVMYCIAEHSTGSYFSNTDPRMMPSRIIVTPAECVGLQTTVNDSKTVDQIQEAITLFLDSNNTQQQDSIELDSPIICNLRTQLGLLRRDPRWSAASPTSAYLDTAAATSPNIP